MEERVGGGDRKVGGGEGRRQSCSSSVLNASNTLQSIGTPYTYVHVYIYNILK